MTLIIGTSVEPGGRSEFLQIAQIRWFSFLRAGRLQVARTSQQGRL